MRENGEAFEVSHSLRRRNKRNERYSRRSHTIEDLEKDLSKGIRKAYRAGTLGIGTMTGATATSMTLDKFGYPDGVTKWLISGAAGMVGGIITYTTGIFGEFGYDILVDKHYERKEEREMREEIKQYQTEYYEDLIEDELKQFIKTVRGNKDERVISYIEDFCPSRKA